MSGPARYQEPAGTVCGCCGCTADRVGELRRFHPYGECCRECMAGWIEYVIEYDMTDSTGIVETLKDEGATVWSIIDHENIKHVDQVWPMERSVT